MRHSRPGPRVTSVPALSPRLRAVVDSLPLRPGLRVIEIGCGPGAAAREVARRVGPDGHVLAIDRSPRAIAQLVASARDVIDAGVLTARTVACEELVLDPGEARYDLAFAVRVGALDGRHPEVAARALGRLADALVPGGRLLIDGGEPLREVALQVRDSTGGGAPRRASSREREHDGIDVTPFGSRTIGSDRGRTGSTSAGLSRRAAPCASTSDRVRLAFEWPGATTQLHVARTGRESRRGAAMDRRHPPGA